MSQYFKTIRISSLLIATAMTVQPVFAVEFNAAQDAANITEEGLEALPVEIISSEEPSIASIDAMQAAPAPEYQVIDAEEQLNNYLAGKGLRGGWIEEKKMYVTTGVAFFDSEDPAYDDSFITKRSIKSMEATLMAKADIIEFINTTMSALDKVDIVGTDIFAKFNEQKIKNQKRLMAQKKRVALLLDDVDKKMADELRGVTFSDRMKSYMDAAIKKLDETYSTEKISADKLAKYQKAKARYQESQAELDRLEQEMSEFQGQERGKSSSQVATLARMPLFGAVTVNQFESWDDQSEQYKVALLVMWSKSSEKMARSMITGEALVIPPGPETLQAWLQKQDWATITGGRRFRDEKGDGWFIGVDARPVGASSSAERQARGLAEMSAKKEVAMSLYSDMESKKQAQTVLIEKTNKQGQDISEAAGSFTAHMRASLNNRSISGLQKLYGKKVTHPVSGQQIYVAVYGMSSNTARQALAMQDSNYVTKMLDIKSQQKMQGTKAGLDAAARAASQNKKSYYDAKHNASKQAVSGESKKSSSSSKSSSPGKGSKSGVYGGGAADSFDW